MRVIKQPIILGLLALSSGSIFAAGFQLQEQSATSLGAAYAGTAALSANANSNFYNVASLTHTPHTNYSVGAFSVVTSGPVHIEHATNSVGTPITGEMTDHPGTLAFIPSFGVARRVNDNVFVGFNLGSAFGLKTAYDETRPMRYVATRSEIRSFDLTPSIAYRYNEWSVGLGYNYTFVRAHLDASTGLGYVPDDGFIKVSGDDWVSSMKIGVLYDMTETTRFGMQYRSKMDVKIRNGELSAVTMGAPAIDSLTSDITLPEMFTVSMVHAVAPHWSLLGDVSWVNWDRFEKLVFKSQNHGILNITEDWQAATRVALGLENQYSDKWTFRFGAAYDHSPVPDDRRTARVPDNDRIWLSMGTSYHVNKHLSLDAGYAHLFIRDAAFANTAVDGSTAFVSAESKGRADVLGLQVNMNY